MWLSELHQRPGLESVSVGGYLLALFDLTDSLPGGLEHFSGQVERDASHVADVQHAGLLHRRDHLYELLVGVLL